MATYLEALSAIGLRETESFDVQKLHMLQGFIFFLEPILCLVADLFWTFEPICYSIGSSICGHMYWFVIW